MKSKLVWNHTSNLQLAVIWFEQTNKPNQKNCAHKFKCSHGLRQSGCLPFTKCFQKIQLESTWNMTLWFVPEENFQEQWNFWKGSLVFSVRMFQMEICVLFFIAIFDNSFRLSWPFFAKMELIYTNGKRDFRIKFTNLSWILLTVCPNCEPARLSMWQ